MRSGDMRQINTAYATAKDLQMNLRFERRQMFMTHVLQRRLLLALLLVALSLTMIGGTSAAPFLGVIPLPNGFRPEGIASGNGTTFYAVSLGTGAVYRGDLRTGDGAVLVPGQEGHIAVGLKFDART